MGRKKKKTMKPWCWYCNREFEDEKILLQHQKAKHFKCHICHKKLFTGPGLQIHCMQVHKENIEKVPNSIKGRDNITLEICGMENIPEEDLIDHERQKTISTRDDESDSDEDRHLNHAQPPPPPLPPSGPPVPTGPPGWAPPLPGLKPPQPPQAAAAANNQPPIPPPIIPPQLPPNLPPATAPGMPPNPVMMQQMMMMYPQMAQMMNMNPMMMQQMINMPGMGSQVPQPSPQQQQIRPQQQQTMPQVPSSGPKPLMSLMGVNAKPSFDSSTSKNPKPLFPSAANEYVGDLNHHHSHLNDYNYVPKIENPMPGSKIVHPEDDISLEEYRASHHKYKYITPQYSAPPEPLVHMQQHRSNPNFHNQQQHISHQQQQKYPMSHHYGRNGKRY